ncbi:MAG TPA: type II and III secretion system protein family protein [Candidatus Acidoferrales bacterium]|nr:type II and III secretion system protein family protein [Candidatus Acidoferrales bacterium]
MSIDPMNKNKAATTISTVCFAILTCATPFFGQDGVATMATPPPLSAASMGAQQPQASPQVAAEGNDRLHLLVGRSLVISSPTRVKRISVADPNIADAIVISPYQVLLNGKTPGGVSLIIWDESDQSQTFEIFVDQDILGLSQKIREVFPNEPIHVEASKDLVMISGHASTKAVQSQILAIVQAVTPKVVNLMEAPTAPTTGEILLQVRFAEVDRSALTEFGVNLFYGGGSNVAATSTQEFSAPTLINPTPTTSAFGISDLLNMFYFRPDLNLGATIRDLQQKNIIQILAEPNLLTATGKEASFLAGGEFPYPVVQGTTGGTTGNAITIQFREYGVRLTFTPTIMENGQIHLKVKPEVSALDYSNALTISGFTIPAISTKKVESEMDLMDGQSFAIAGLVDDRVTRLLSKVPGLGDLPVLGQLFKSVQFSKSKTELLILITPRIVKPLSPNEIPAGPQFPTPFLEPAKAGTMGKP